MKKKMFPRTISFLISLGVAASAIPVADYPAVMAASAAAPADTVSTAVLNSEEEEIVQGEVIVTIAAPGKPALAREQDLPFDDSMAVEESWSFGDAEILAETEAQADFLRERNLYISKVTSDCYSTEELMDKLANQAYVVSVEPNRYRKAMSVSEPTALTSDSFSGQQWYLDGKGSFTTESTGIHYAKTSSSGDKPVVAVVDTGIDYTHEDLKDHMWVNTNTSLPGTNGYDFGDNDSDPMDDEGHGTHCAGIIGAVTDNDTGIAGVAADVELMALKVFNKKGEVEDASIISAFEYIYKAQQLGVPIVAVNCSWGGGESGSSMEALVNKIGGAGALFLFAAGNDAINQDIVISSRKECPYDMDSEYIVLVGASNQEDNAASFSDYGTESVDLFAPGVQIFSTVNYTNFLPSAYPEEERESLTTLYSAGEEGSVDLYTPPEIGLSSGQVSYGEIVHSTKDFYGNTASGSFYVPMHTASKRDSSFSVYLDIDALDLDTSDVYQVACDMASTSSDTAGSDELEWTHFTRMNKNTDYVSANGKMYMRLISLEGSLQDYTGFYLDHIAISSPNLDGKYLTKYDYMDGTSMATPVISGAVAVLAGMYPSDTAYQRKTRLLSCVQKKADLNYKCKTGGILDMSLFSASATPSQTTPPSEVKEDPVTPPKEDTDKILVKKVKLNKSSAKLRYKKSLKLKATITPKNATNQNIKWSVSKKKYVKVSQKGVVKAKKKGIGHTVKIYATAKDGSGKKATCKVKIKKAA